MGRGAVLLRALSGLPEVAAGDDLAALIVAALASNDLSIEARDILVVAQKVVSKAEGRRVDLRTVTPSARAVELGAIALKDPRFVEVVLGESTEVVRAVPNVLITRHRLGYVMASAGVDHSNVGAASNDDEVLLLPLDPDGSAAALASALGLCCGVAPAVIISDSFGRPWRQGVVNIALGVAGLVALADLRGGRDRDGRLLQTTQVAIADAVAAAAGLVMGEGAEGTPVVLVRGLDWSAPDADGRALLRPPQEDLFR